MELSENALIALTEYSYTFDSNVGHFLKGRSSQGQVTQLLAGTDAGTGVRGYVGVWGGGGILLLRPTVWAGSG